MYEEIINEDGGMVILHTDATGTQWSIPADENNRMYQQYLIWKQENN